MKTFTFYFSCILLPVFVYSSELLKNGVEEMIRKIEPLTVELRWSLFENSGDNSNGCPRLLIGRELLSDQYVFDRVALRERLRFSVSYFVRDKKGDLVGRSFISQMGGSHSSDPEILEVRQDTLLNFEVCEFADWFKSALLDEFSRSMVIPESVERLEVEFGVREFLLQDNAAGGGNPHKVTLLAKPINLDQSQVIKLIEAFK